ncbi:MFS transporter [Streptomyces bambusae]|uniref:MFS transporter n=1 Tax=Streptomyces bambusae TaxID=1550616 RepID=UPI001CFCB280|nr:MFS transporter [Streptomyces bambusae]MCB5165672.1 MFS transporter [Streptomyces bambusae]
MSVAKPPVHPQRPGRRSVVATVVGNFVESFDWLAYGLFAPLFAAQFFPSDDPVTSLLGAFAVYGTGMLFRPLGGILLGKLADRRGRRPALMVAIGLMGGGSLLIGIVPTYEQIGIVAPLVLLTARLAQGVSSGGEWTAAATYLMEIAPPRRRCFYGSLFSMTTMGGAFAASLLGGALTNSLGHDTMTAWGWRVPFLLGGLFSLILLVLRSRLTETDVFRREVRSRPARGSLRAVLRGHGRQVLMAAALVGGLGVVGGTWSTAVPAMGHRLAGSQTMFAVAVTVTAVMMAVQPLLGALADRVDAGRFLAASSVLFAVVGSYGYLTVDGSFGRLVLAYGSGVFFLGCVTVVLPKALSRIFPPEVRGLGIGLPHATTTAVLGGVGPLLAAWSADRGASGWFIAGLMAVVLLAWPAAVLARSVRLPEPAEPAREPAGLSA